MSKYFGRYLLGVRLIAKSEIAGAKAGRFVDGHPNAVDAAISNRVDF